MSNSLGKALVSAAALFILTGSAMGQKSHTGRDGVPHLKPPTDKEIKSLLAMHGTDNWNFKPAHDGTGSMVSDVTEISKHNAFLLRTFPGVNGDSTVVERRDPSADRNMTAQVAGQKGINAQTIDAANWQVIVAEQEKAKVAFARPPLRQTSSPAPQNN